MAYKVSEWVTRRLMHAAARAGVPAAAPTKVPEDPKPDPAFKELNDYARKNSVQTMMDNALSAGHAHQINQILPKKGRL